MTTTPRHARDRRRLIAYLAREFGVTFGQYYEMGALKFGSKDWWKFVGEAQATSREAKLFHKYGTVPTALRRNVLR